MTLALQHRDSNLYDLGAGVGADELCLLMKIIYLIYLLFDSI